jgi:hypothetical protein
MVGSDSAITRRRAAYAIEREIDRRTVVVTRRCAHRDWITPRDAGMEEGLVIDYQTFQGEHVMAQFGAEELMAFRSLPRPETEEKISHIVALLVDYHGDM